MLNLVYITQLYSTETTTNNFINQEIIKNIFELEDIKKTEKELQYNRLLVEGDFFDLKTVNKNIATIQHNSKNNDYSDLTTDKIEASKKHLQTIKEHTTFNDIKDKADNLLYKIDYKTWNIPEEHSMLKKILTIEKSLQDNNLEGCENDIKAIFKYDTNSTFNGKVKTFLDNLKIQIRKQQTDLEQIYKILKNHDIIDPIHKMVMVDIDNISSDLNKLLEKIKITETYNINKYYYIVNMFIDNINIYKKINELNKEPKEIESHKILIYKLMMKNHKNKIIHQIKINNLHAIIAGIYYISYSRTPTEFVDSNDLFNLLEINSSSAFNKDNTNNSVYNNLNDINTFLSNLDVTYIKKYQIDINNSKIYDYGVGHIYRNLQNAVVALEQDIKNLETQCNTTIADFKKNITSYIRIEILKKNPILEKTNKELFHNITKNMNDNEIINRYNTTYDTIFKNNPLKKQKKSKSISKDPILFYQDIINSFTPLKGYINTHEIEKKQELLNITEKRYEALIEINQKKIGVLFPTNHHYFHNSDTHAKYDLFCRSLNTLIKIIFFRFNIPYEISLLIDQVSLIAQSNSKIIYLFFFFILSNISRQKMTIGEYVNKKDNNDNLLTNIQEFINRLNEDVYQLILYYVMIHMYYNIEKKTDELEDLNAKVQLMLEHDTITSEDFSIFLEEYTKKIINTNDNDITNADSGTILYELWLKFIFQLSSFNTAPEEIKTTFKEYANIEIFSPDITLKILLFILLIKTPKGIIIEPTIIDILNKTYYIQLLGYYKKHISTLLKNNEEHNNEEHDNIRDNISDNIARFIENEQNDTIYKNIDKSTLLEKIHDIVNDTSNDNDEDDDTEIFKIINKNIKEKNKELINYINIKQNYRNINIMILSCAIIITIIIDRLFNFSSHKKQKKILYD